MVKLLLEELKTETDVPSPSADTNVYNLHFNLDIEMVQSICSQNIRLYKKMTIVSVYSRLFNGVGVLPLFDFFPNGIELHRFALLNFKIRLLSLKLHILLHQVLHSSRSISYGTS